LDQQQDNRQLSPAELQQRKEANDKILGYAVIQKVKIRQQSRFTWIRAADANTKLFHLRANTRRCRNHISTLIHGGTTLITLEAKENILTDFFNQQFRQAQTRQHTLN
jgi:hypothetical protein